MHAADLAAALARDSAGSNNAASNATIAITTISSIKVKPFTGRGQDLLRGLPVDGRHWKVIEQREKSDLFIRTFIEWLPSCGRLVFGSAHN